ncbi:MAG TPA: hypothetical protein VKQ32_06240, partial [Polyangia bacterium]|nr:hypothetical protein [Polyangia bacterium]
MRRSTFLAMLGLGGGMAALGYRGRRRIMRRLDRAQEAFGAGPTPAYAKGPRFPDGPPLVIPKTRPRLWWNAERLERARRWYASNHFAPRDDRPMDLALHYVLAREARSARTLIDWAMAMAFEVGGVASDKARWHGEAVILAYDWCYDQMTAAERATLIPRWNGYIETLDAKPWGGPGMESNNYFLGYFRNALEWGIATYHENPRAAAILQNALTVRWRDGFLPWAAGPGKGGVPHEGTQYGRLALNYFTIPFVTARLLGRDMWNETPYFKELIYYFIYSMTPAKTVNVLPNKPSAKPARHYETFPYNEDEFWGEGNSAAGMDVGSFLAPLVEEWEGRPIAGLIQRYLDVTECEVGRYAAAVAKKVAPGRFDTLPLDYYAPGLRFFYAKDSWRPDAMLVTMQLGLPVGVGHDHLDAGSFQICRGGRWLTRETVSYTELLAGWNNGPREDGRLPIGHNVVLFGGRGMVQRRSGPPAVPRLESRQQHAFAAVDLTPAYRLRQGLDADREGNPYVDTVVRELLYVRPLQALLVFDRLRGSGREGGAVKTFLLHFEAPPKVDGPRSVLATNGDQALRVLTLAPATVTYRVVNEGTPVGLYRLEVDTVGAPVESYFLHVLAGRDAAAPDLTA